MIIVYHNVHDASGTVALQHFFSSLIGPCCAWWRAGVCASSLASSRSQLSRQTTAWPPHSWDWAGTDSSHAQNRRHRSKDGLIGPKTKIVCVVNNQLGHTSACHFFYITSPEILRTMLASPQALAEHGPHDRERSRIIPAA